MKKKLLVILGLCFAVGLSGTACGSNSSARASEDTIIEESIDDSDNSEEVETEVEDTGDTSDDEAETDEQTEEETEAESTDLEGIRPEFKEAMDSYESFMNEYCEFMSKLEESNYDSSLMDEYNDYVDKYADVMNSFSKIGTEEMSDEEAKYYSDVNLRMLEKERDMIKQ